MYTLDQILKVSEASYHDVALDALGVSLETGQLRRLWAALPGSVTYLAEQYTFFDTPTADALYVELERQKDHYLALLRSSPVARKPTRDTETAMEKTTEMLLKPLSPKDIETLERVAHGDTGYLNNLSLMTLMAQDLIEPNRPGVNFRLTERGQALWQAEQDRRADLAS